MSDAVWPEAEVVLTPEQREVHERMLLEMREWSYTGNMSFCQRQGHRMAQAMSASAGCVSLDVGCGTSIHLAFAATRFRRVGVELRVDHLRVAGITYPGFIRLRRTPARFRLPASRSTASSACTC